MQYDAEKTLKVVVAVLGLVNAIAGLLTKGALRPWLYWLGNAAGLFVIFLALSYGVLKYLGDRSETAVDPEDVLPLSIGTAAGLAIVITLLSVDNPGSAQTEDAQDFGFFQVLGVLSLVGGAAAAALLWQRLQKGEA